jgi:hypothetical protein
MEIQSQAAYAMATQQGLARFQQGLTSLRRQAETDQATVQALVTGTSPENNASIAMRGQNLNIVV